MQVLITGGSGFIGAWIMARFHKLGASFRILDTRQGSPLAAALLGPAYQRITWIEGDVSDADAVHAAAQDCTLIVHLAAMLTPACQAEPIRGAQVNLLGTLNVFAAAHRAGMQRVLYMSSAGVFGPHDGDIPRPTTHYGAFKLAGEGCARAYWDDKGLASAGFRPLIVYGPGRDIGLTAGPSLACRAAAQGQPYVIPFGGDSDFVFVDDVAAAFELAWRDPLDGANVFNVVGERASAAAIARHINDYAQVSNIAANGPPIPVAANISEGDLRVRYPQMPRTPLAAGLGQTIEFYRANAL